MTEADFVRPPAMSLRQASERDGDRRVFPSGSQAIDGLLGGGFRTGELVEVFGASGTGKTQLGMQSTISVAAAGFSCAYVDSEGQFRPERLSSMCESRGLEPTRILPLVFCIRADSTRQQVEAISKIRTEEGLKRCKMVVVDTVTRNFTLEFGGSRLVASRQAALGVYLNRLARDAYGRDRAVLLLNRVASVGRDENLREVDIGGDTLRHFVQRAVWLQRRGEHVYASLADETNPREVMTRITGRGLE
jgi:RecA/RadA recombinase